MTACAAHPDREGTAPCDTCTAPMCDRCIDHAPAKWPGRCVACKAKDPKPVVVLPPAAPPLPPLPKRWVFRVLALVLLAAPAFPALMFAAAFERDHTPEPRVMSPAHIGAHSGRALLFVVGGAALLWCALGDLMLLARWRFARFFYVPYFAALAWAALGFGRDLGHFAFAGYAAAMIAFLLFSKDLKAALPR